MKFTLLIFCAFTTVSVSTDATKKDHLIGIGKKNLLKMKTEAKDIQVKEPKRRLEEEDVPYYFDDHLYGDDDDYIDDFIDDDFNDDKKYTFDDDSMFSSVSCSYDTDCFNFFGDDVLITDADDGGIGFDCVSPVCSDGICSIGFLSCAQCSSPQGSKDVEISIKTDDHPMATTWIIRDTDTVEDLMWSPVYKKDNYTYSSSKCFSPGTYKFTIWDFWADGFQGSYSVTVAGEEVEMKNNFSLSKDDFYFNVTECVYDEDCSYINDDYSCISSPICSYGFCSSEYLNCADCNLIEAKDVEFSITTDNYPSEISWNIIDSDTGKEVMKGGSYTVQFESYTSTKCFDYGSYKLTLLDSYGDGLIGDDSKFSLVVGGQTVGNVEDFYSDIREIHFDVTNKTFSYECEKKSDCDNDDVCTLSSCETGYCSKEYLSCSECGLVDDVEVLFTTDYYPNEISWNIRDTLTDIEVMKGGSYTDQYQTHSALKCFDYGSYKFTIQESDRYGYFGNYYLLLRGKEIAQGAYYGQEKEMLFNITRECIYDSDCDNTDTCTTSSCVNGICSKKYLVCSECNLDQDVGVTIQTDSFPSETSWAIIHTGTGEEIMGGGNYTNSFEAYDSVKCFESGWYKFTIFDAYGDGLAYGGGYSLVVGEEEITSGGGFTFYEEVKFNIPEEGKGMTKAEIGESCVQSRDCYSKKCQSKTCCRKRGDACSLYSECCSDSCNSGLCE